jgi:NodT family efflux transporter outer membrane factor (OMF) lipoprotein
MADTGTANARVAAQKFFWFFFFKKRTACLLLLCSCAPPLPPVDTSVHVAGYLPGQATVVVPGPLDWWKIFGSPGLNDLEAQGLAANPTLAEAAANLRAAQAAAAAANGGFLPQVEIGGDNTSLVSRSAFPTGPNETSAYSVYTPSGFISYDPGLFGVAHYTRLNGRAQAAMAAAQGDATKATLAGNIAMAAITESGIAAQITVTQQILGAEQGLLTLLQGEYEVGAVTQLAVLQQQSVIDATAATLPNLRTQLVAQRDRLAILTGRLPADFDVPALDLEHFTVPSAVPEVLPSTYLETRPDIRAALATVAAQNASLGLAVAHFYPDVSLTAQGGFAAQATNVLFQPGSIFWTLAGNLLAPLYEGGTLSAKRDQAQAQLAAALAAYHDTVLTAFGQAADALAAVQNGQDAVARALTAAETAGNAYKLAKAQFQLGAVDDTTVLTAQAQAAQAALTLAVARTNLLLAIATLEAAQAP